MGIFKTLVNDLVGIEKEYAVKDLGIFTCKVCNWWKDKQYTWGGTVRLPFYSEETVILLEGDASAPFAQQLLELQTLLQNWKSMITRLDSMLPNESRLAHKEEIYVSWQDTFYPEAINPAIPTSDGWEITFARKDDLKDYFDFIWKNNTVRELTLEVGA
ncbi:hypothetical protein [Bacteroides sp. GM023]|uniref:hypothetical protein n=1 Tax=Bacteroides sp. GM023 TaxID=2723058 RepID=UPI00168B8EFC|nr:hypothetical protein [Bacteroides sp. GM023]MBD3589728.1 hypothetical protein [Bacteroides sp. GM023]